MAFEEGGWQEAWSFKASSESCYTSFMGFFTGWIIRYVLLVVLTHVLCGRSVLGQDTSGLDLLYRNQKLLPFLLLLLSFSICCSC